MSQGAARARSCFRAHCCAVRRVVLDVKHLCVHALCVAVLAQVWVHAFFPKGTRSHSPTPEVTTRDTRKRGFQNSSRPAALLTSFPVHPSETLPRVQMLGTVPFSCMGVNALRGVRHLCLEVPASHFEGSRSSCNSLALPFFPGTKQLRSPDS